MSNRCSDECLFHWAAVVGAASTAWERKFAEEIAVKARKPWWRPTSRQLTIMQHMVDALFCGDPHSLIEATDREGRAA